MPGTHHRPVILKESTEAQIMAAREQPPSTRAIDARVYHIRRDTRCRSCKGATKTTKRIRPYLQGLITVTLVERVIGIYTRGHLIRHVEDPTL